MRIVALDSYDNIPEGMEYDCPDGQALKLIAKGLAKAGPIPVNKMAEPSENKGNPSEAVGEVRQSSASPAAPASPEPIASESASGGMTRGQRAAATRAANRAKAGK
jgi:hypothetical protein